MFVSLFRDRFSVLVAVALVGASLSVVSATPARAANDLTVSTNADVAGNDGLCSLREAITAANTDSASGAAVGECPAGSGDDTILLSAAGSYVLGSALPTITTNIVFKGNNRTVDGALSFRPFSVSGATVLFSDITITNGAAVRGGGLLTESGADVTIARSVISNNTATGNGGGIFVGSAVDLSLSLSTVSDNNAALNGGGVYVTGGSLVLGQSSVLDNMAVGLGGGILATALGASVSSTESTVARNQASNGGGIYALAGVTLDLVNSTVSVNTATTAAGGIYSNGASTSVVFTTITANTAPSAAGARAQGGSFAVSGSIVEGNIGAGDDVHSFGGLFSSGGFNVIGDGNATGSFNQSGDVTGVLAGLGPLASNGGPTDTHVLLISSPAVDRVSGVLSPDPAVDQRGLVRPRGLFKDSGAFEFEPHKLTVLSGPCLIYDSRSATAPGLSGPLTDAEGPRQVKVTGVLPGQGGALGCTPPGSSAVVFTISAVDAAGAGNLRLSAAGVVPNGGVVNYTNNGLNNANTVTVPLSAGGAVDIKSNVGTTDVRLVAVGYYSFAGLLTYFPLTPCAAVDTRASQGASGPFVGPFAAGSAFPDVDVAGTFPTAQGGDPAEIATTRSCGVPSGADAVVVNLVAVNTTGGTGFLSIGTGGTNPAVESATPFAALGMNNAATAIVTVSGTGMLAIDVDALTVTPSTEIRVVVMGYLDTSGGVGYQPLNPCAAFDTRSSQGATGGFEGNRLGDQTTTYQITGDFPTAQGGDPNEVNTTRTCGVPDSATAVLVNLVAANSVAPGNLRAFATGTTPSGGLLNFADLTPAMNNANAVIIPLSALGELDVFTNGGPAGLGNPITQTRGVILGFYN